MCTVTFVQSNGKTIITSNRDEKVLREPAVEPMNYLINNKIVTFPKDQKGGGTWYAVNEDVTVLVLLNGAAEKHELKTSYKKSRGLVVLDIIGCNSPILEWETIDLTGIEPFTLVLFQDKKLFQLRWNEINKETILLDASQNYIWSSSTLYSAELRQKRAQWFSAFLDTKQDFSSKELFHFHRYTEEQNQEHGLVINRSDVLKTVSITQTVIENNKVKICYNDLITEKEFSNAFLTI
ncbi:NRDE family protein [Flavobacterium soyangense]|uniref:NRDE family protein n=1 Tax=Flavobacterium soyangense TaxID=2023265 RepID=A0A930XVS2_9FLAO|nr:NRDE family protein [Flavobacterium soyangense]MBF2708422.1 NRDE family protein [Flavobacterium soyangense]